MHPSVARSEARPLVRLATAAVTAGILVAGLGLAEAVLRYNGKFATYLERNGLPDPGHFTDYLREPYLYTYAKNHSEQIAKSEFTIDLTTNAEGLVGPDFPVAKAPDEFRIIAIGDSFTEGTGAKLQDSYPAVLERLLASRHDRHYTIMNAGLSGNDPVYCVELLRRKLLRYKPDLVILTLNHSDVDDLKRRGGIDRFDSNGQPKPLALPSWSGIFDRSHVVRAVVLGILGYDWDLRSPQKSKEATEQAVKGLIESGIRGAQLGAENGFRFLILIHPGWWELYSGYPPEVLAAQRGLQNGGVDTADVLAFFREAVPTPVPPDYYWPKDNHYTAKGYAVMAKAVYAEIEKRGILKP